MWNNLSEEWKKTFEQAWLAFQHGSIPIGAIITDEKGNVLITGRNETCETHYPNKRTAHAEIYCVRNLDIEKYPNLGEYHLYTTMEPCPMCMGTIVMGGIRKVHVAANDRYCGALNYIKKDPYMQSKNMNIFLEEGELEMVQLVQQGYHELRRYNGEFSKVLRDFQSDASKSIALAQKLYKERYLDKCLESNIPYFEIYDTICKLLGN